MATFAIYQYLFDKLNKYDRVIPFKEFSFEDKQTLFGKLFKDDFDLHFIIEEKPEYNHVLIPCKLNDDIIILRIGNTKKKKFDQFDKDTKLFETDDHEYNPDCYAFIDNRKDVQRIAIQKKSDSFSSPNQVAKILQTVFCKYLKSYDLSLEINPKMHSDEFFHVVKQHQNKFAYVKFNYAHPNLPAISDLITEIEDAAEETNSDPSLELNQKVSGEPIIISEKSERIQRYAKASAAQGKPIHMKTIDGISYEIFVVDEDNNDETKQVFVSMSSKVLENLDDKDLQDSAMGHIVEFMNNLKLYYE